MQRASTPVTTIGLCLNHVVSKFRFAWPQHYYSQNLPLQDFLQPVAKESSSLQLTLKPYATTDATEILLTQLLEKFQRVSTLLQLTVC